MITVKYRKLFAFAVFFIGLVPFIFMVPSIVATFKINLRPGMVLEDKINEVAFKGDLQSVQSLLSKGVSIEGRSIHYMTPIMSAAEGGHENVVKLLLSKGADPNGHNDSCSALMFAVSRGNPRVVQLLLKHGADVNWKSSIGDTALVAAMEKKDPEMLKILQKSGAK